MLLHAVVDDATLRVSNTLESLESLECYRYMRDYLRP